MNQKILKKKKNTKKGINGLQIGLFSEVMRLNAYQIISRRSGKTSVFLLKKCWSMKALDKVRDSSDDA